ncbi:MAG: alanine--tRNA ligase [SAR86 cluster bacterium]
MKAKQVRKTYIDYFRSKGHELVDSDSLVPQNDPSLLFTNAGMVPFKDVLLGVEKRPYTRAVSSQRCLRVGGKHNDLENVGYTARHHTFFEMLGNFSFGDYFKKEAIAFAWELLTENYSIPAEKLWITVFKDDDESETIWREDIGVPAERISRLDEEDNFWTMGDTGPCGPCSEIYYDHGPEIEGSPPAIGSDPGDRFIEIWNLVFAQFDRSQDGSLSPLPSPCVDTGLGLERMAAVLQGKHSNFETDLFTPLIKDAAKICGTKDLNNPSLKVISDHLRASAFLVADGVSASNEGRGYVLRRIIRRALRHADKLGADKPVMSSMVPTLVKQMSDAYPILKKNSALIQANILQEEEQFASTLVQGMSLLKEEVKNLKGKTISGELIFKLYDTYGFPPDMTADFARENNLKVDLEGYEKSMNKQKERGREASAFSSVLPESLNLKGSTDFVGYEKDEVKTKILELVSLSDGKTQEDVKKNEETLVILDKTPFYAESGGQVGDSGALIGDKFEFQVTDTQKIGDHVGHIGALAKGSVSKGDGVLARINKQARNQTALNHSATHLLNSALRTVLGDHVEQRGSLVNEEKLRFDFVHQKQVTKGEIKEIEVIVNSEIRANSKATTETMPIKEAEKKGALAFFGEKYGEEVRVLSMGGDFSVELCGGTHVQRTGDIGYFKIITETSISAGVRRIEALTGEAAVNLSQDSHDNLDSLALKLNTSSEEVRDKISQLIDSNKTLKQELDKLRSSSLSATASDMSLESEEIAGLKVIAKKMEGLDSSVLRETADKLRNKEKNSLIVLISIFEDKVPLVVATHKELDQIDARDVMNHLVNLLGGSGGGRSDFAQGGIEKVEDIEIALASLSEFLVSLNS